MVYYGEFLNKEVESKLVKRLFEEESNEQIFDILEGYKRHNNYLDLKNQIYAYLEESIPEYQDYVSKQSKDPKDISDAIEIFQKKGEITHQDYQLLRDLLEKGDRHLGAAWEAYTVMKDIEDLLDTILILCDVKREAMKSGNA